MSSGSTGGEFDLTGDFRVRYRKLHDDIRRLGFRDGWATSGEVVMSSGPMQLRRFIGVDDDSDRVRRGNSGREPVLIIYSHVNRPSIIDLEPDRSLIRNLQRHGHAVHLLEWLPVKHADAENDLSLYVDAAIDAAVDWLAGETGVDAVNLIGVCQGGTFSLCYAALHPDRVARLVTLVTPVDFFAGDSLLTRWVEKVDFALLAAHPRNVPGAALTALFQALRPFDDMRRHIRLVNGLGNGGETLDLSAKIDRWVIDCPDQPGRAFAQFAQQCFQENRLVVGNMMIGHKQIDLSGLAMPILNVYANYDHLVPPASSTALAEAVPAAHYHEIAFAGGHVGLLVSERAQQTVMPKIGQWLADLTV